MLVNAVAVLVGGLVGLVVGVRLPSRVRDGALAGVAFGVVLIGLGVALDARANPVLVVVSLAVGGAIGAALRLEERLDRLRTRAGSSGFVLASMVFCVGPMAVVGSLQAGLTGDGSILLAKAALDGATSAVLASTLGAGVLLAALPVLVYEGAITLSAAALRAAAGAPVQSALAGTGGLLIVGIGLDLLGIARIKVADLLPGLVLAAVLAWAVTRFGIRLP